MGRSTCHASQEMTLDPGQEGVALISMPEDGSVVGLHYRTLAEHDLALGRKWLLSKGSNAREVTVSYLVAPQNVVHASPRVRVVKGTLLAVPVMNKGMTGAKVTIVAFVMS